MVLVKSKFSMRFGGVELMQWIDGVTNIDRNIGQNRTASLLKVAHTNGELFQYTTAAHGTITVTALIFTDIHRRELAQALMSDEPQQLIFGDEPDKYYQAIVDGQSTVAEAYYNNILTIVFIVPDAIAHSVATQTADNMPYKDAPVNLLTGTSNVKEYILSGSGWSLGSQSSNGNSCSIQATPGVSYTYSVLVKSTTYDCYPEILFFDSSKNEITNFPDVNGKDIGMRKITAVAPENTAFVGARMVLQNPPDSQTVVFNSEKLEADPEYCADTITVHNGGTYPVYPVIEATMHSDNGLVAFVNDQGGVLQFGDPEEIDGETKEHSERALREGMDTAPSDMVMNQSASNYPDYIGTTNPNVQTGAVAFGADNSAKDPAGGYECQPVYGTAAAGVWSGPSLYLPIKPNTATGAAGNFVMKTRFSFAALVANAGRLEVNLQNSDAVAYGAILRDSSALDDKMFLEFWVGSTRVSNMELDKKKFTNGRYKELVISRFGNTVTFTISVQAGISSGNVAVVQSPISVPWTLTDEANVPVDGWSAWFMRFPGLTPTPMSLSDLQFDWANVDYWSDLPNRFSTGDVITADVANKTIYVNGVEDMTLHTVGNQWDKFVLQPGENTIEAIGSSWCTTPLEVSVQYREAYY